LAFSNKAAEQSKFSSWRGRGLASMLLHFVVRRTLHSLINEPSSFVMQCTVPAPNGTESATLASLAGVTSVSPIGFYRRLGGIVVSEREANGWAFLQTDLALVLLLEIFQILWVGAASCKMMLIHIQEHRLLCPLLRIWDYNPGICPSMMSKLGSRLAEQSM
jgi:hypothetical protein